MIGPDVNNIHKCVPPDLASPNKHNYDIDWALQWAHKHCSVMQFLTKFLSTSENAVDAVTLHDYYLRGKVAVKDDFLSPVVMNTLKSRVELFKKAFPERTFWLGETGSASGGGAAGLSDR